MRNLRSWVYRKLRLSESFFKTDMVYLAKGGTWLSGGQVIVALASFGSALLFARLIPQEVYGNYKYILSLAGLMTAFSLTGLSTAVLQSVARGFHGTFMTAVRTLLRWNSLIFAAGMGGALYYLANGNTTLGYGLVIVSILFPGIKTFELYESYLNGRKDFRRSAIYRSIVDIGAITATAAGLLFTDSTLLLVAINLSTQFVLDALFFSKAYRSIPKENSTVEPGSMEFGKHLSLQNMMGNVSAYIDKILIFHYLGAAEVAVYAFATAIPQQIKGLVSNVVLLVTPKLALRTAPEAVRIIEGRFLLSLSVLAPLVVLYVLFAPLIFDIFFPAYTEAVPYTRWYSLVLLIMGNLSGLVLTTQKAARERYILTTYASVSQIVLMLVFVHNYGILGIIWAILIAKATTAILSYILAKRIAAKSIE